MRIFSTLFSTIFLIVPSDGVGDGQFELCKQFEFAQLKQACRLVDASYNPDITFIVVQKRVNTRIFAVFIAGFVFSIIRMFFSIFIFS